jgi:membrane fusion protein (multidrug efflux system)
MSIPFSRTMRALEGDGFGRIAVAVAIIAVLLAGWVSWALFARVGVLVRSTSARLEVGQKAHPVEPAVAGRVARNLLVLGREVKEGDVLVELDATATQLQIAELGARLAGLGPQLAARRRELATQSAAASADSARSPVARAEAGAHAAEAEIAAQQARDALERLQRLRAEKLVSQADLVRAEGDVQRLQSVAVAQRAAAARVAHESTAAEQTARALVGEAEREIAQLESDGLVLTAQLQKLEHEALLHTVRATITGRIAEVVPAPPGRQVQAGERLAAIVPPGEVLLVANLPPAEAFGRVHPGQSARFQLSGFPWMQYGALHATVARVASEVSDGAVRVELTLDPDAPAHIPIEHGLPGLVEIEIERVAPAVLILRGVGRAIDGAGT